MELGNAPEDAAPPDVLDDISKTLFELADGNLSGEEFRRAGLEHNPALLDQTMRDEAVAHPFLQLTVVIREHQVSTQDEMERSTRWTLPDVMLDRKFLKNE